MISVGDAAVLERLISAEDIKAFADLTGDDNPVHLDEEYAKGMVFGRRIAHGAFLAGLISAVLGNKLPGPGCFYLGQGLTFRAPVFIGERVRVRVEVVALREDKPIVTLSTTCIKGDGTLAVEGRAGLKFPL